MRMWMVDPRIMCRKHLLGEHVEMHMFLGHLKRRKKVDGYLKNNCLQMRSIYQRHEDLAKEMIDRGYKHNSPMKELDFECIYDYPNEQIYWKVQEVQSLKDLLDRCPDCRQRSRAVLLDESGGDTRVAV